LLFVVIVRNVLCVLLIIVVMMRLTLAMFRRAVVVN